LDDALGLRVVDSIKRKSRPNLTLVKSDIIMDTIEPYLKTLQTIEPLDIPFAQYLQLLAPLASMKIELPSYARATGFRWNLDHLAKPGFEHPPIAFDPRVPGQIQTVRQLLQEHSVLDGSQADAIVDILTQEVALVQG
jgi:hypothetical protein